MSALPRQDQGTAPPARPLTVAVLAGGRSSEHEISLASGASVRAGLEQAGHIVTWIEIGHDGVWRQDGHALELCPGMGLAGVDVAFPALHGPFGEDGAVQGALEMLGVAYVGSGVTASALCMDKVLFKRVMSTASVPQVNFAGVRRERFEHAQREVLAELAGLGLPVFVKPAHLGSSVGIVKVLVHEQLQDALRGAFAHDELVIVEAMATGLEVECGVLGVPAGERGAGGEQARASLPGEIRFAGEFYDYEAKYAAGGMELTVPAPISARAAARVQELAVAAFLDAGCDGLARVDFFVDGEHVLLNELNTMPGFTPTSVYAKLFEASGIPYAELVDRLCRLALERHERASAYRY
jgi:D-alanine-D-alanine ligase